MPGPWRTGLTYFKYDARQYQSANRPDWGDGMREATEDEFHGRQLPDDLKWTIGTIWNGDPTLRPYYEGHIGSTTLPVFPAHMPDLPQFPYQEEDVAYAKASRALPPERDADGNPIDDTDEEDESSAPASPQAEAPTPDPASPPSATPAVPPANDATGYWRQQCHSCCPPPPQNQQMQYLTHSPGGRWPTQPWHAEPAHDGTTLGIRMHLSEGSQEEGDRFKNTKPYMWPEKDENNWHGVRLLGRGSFGCAGLWCRVDETGSITDCMAIKEIKAKDEDWRDRLPREIRIHQIIDQNRPAGRGRGHESLLEHRGYRLMMRYRRFRIYMNYYEGGSLTDAVEENELRARKPDVLQYAGHDMYDVAHLDRNGDPPQILPEGFIWWILRCLVDACQVLHFGQASDVDGVKADWNPITHLDIGMANIFLRVRPIRHDGSHLCPEVVLADYGMAICATSVEFLFKAHDARFAPHRWMDDEEPVQMNDKTDIRQIACVIFDLMVNGSPQTLEGVPVVNRNLHGALVVQKMFWPALGPMNTDMEGDVNAWPHAFFPTIAWYNGTSLPQLIRRCLNWNKDLRPTLVELRNRIDDEFQKHPEWEQEATIRPA